MTPTTEFRNTPKEYHRGRHPSAPMRFTLLVTATALMNASCKKQASAPPPPPVVTVTEVLGSNVPVMAEFIGQLDSPQNVEVRARVEAFVEKVLFEEGKEVKENAPLFALDKKPFLERLAAANAALAEAKAALNKYEKDVARLKPLAEKRAIPQQDLDNAVASVEVGKANVLSAEARVESAKIDLGYCDVTAPVSGVIGAKQVSVGSLVGKGEPTLLATISTLDPIWFYCNISVADLLQAEKKALESGRKVDDLPVTLVVGLRDGSELTAQGKWVFLDRAADARTDTMRLRAEFPNTNGILRPGMFARARIQLKTEKDSLVIPQRAVQELQGKSFVWVVGQDNKAKQRPVDLGTESGGAVVILKGLSAGERVIVEGVQKVRDGELVQPMTAAQLAQAAAQGAKPPEDQHAGEKTRKATKE